MHSALSPSPLIGTLVYVLFAVPTPTPRFFTTTTLIPPSTALSLTASWSALLSQSKGTGINSVESNFVNSEGLIV